jgi:hypothetical protein
MDVQQNRTSIASDAAAERKNALKYRQNQEMLLASISAMG